MNVAAVALFWLLFELWLLRFRVCNCFFVSVCLADAGVILATVMYVHCPLGANTAKVGPFKRRLTTEKQFPAKKAIENETKKHKNAAAIKLVCPFMSSIYLLPCPFMSSVYVLPYRFFMFMYQTDI